MNSNKKTIISSLPDKEFREDDYLEIDDSDIPSDVQIHIKKRHLKNGSKTRKIHRGTDNHG